MAAEKVQAYHLILLPNFLCKHKTVATLEPIRGVSLLTCINEGGTTLRRPFKDVVFLLSERGRMVIYMIGGSPCSGKSTIASLLARQYQLLHIKLDDLVDEMMSQASADSQPICLLRQDRNPEQILMRNPEEMADEEWRFYEEIFPYVKSYLIKKDRPLLVEGAGLLPHLVKELEWPASSYLCLTPTADFQKKHYRQREWVSYVLEGTTNPEQAFENWMQRDILFAQMVRKEAMRLGYSSLMTDGSQSEKQTAEEIARLLKLYNINEIDIKGENT